MEVCVTEEQRVATIADMMRSKGIKKLKVGDLELEMVDAPVEVRPVSVVPVGASVTPPPEGEPAPIFPADDLCRCGHPMVDHAEHGCLVAGCAIEVCMKAKV